MESCPSALYFKWEDKEMDRRHYIGSFPFAQEEERKGKTHSSFLSSWMPLMHAHPPEGCSSGWKHRHCLQQAACKLSPRKGQVCERETREERLKDAESTEPPARTERCDQVGFCWSPWYWYCLCRAYGSSHVAPSDISQQGQPSQKCLAPKAGDTFKKNNIKKKGPHGNNQHRGLNNTMHNTLQTSTSKRGRDGGKGM